MRTPQCERLECVPGTRPMTAHEQAVAASQSLELLPPALAVVRPWDVQVQIDNATYQQVQRYADLLDISVAAFITNALRARLRECAGLERETVRLRLQEALA